MKNTIFTAILAVITTFSFAQNNAIDRYFSRYKSDAATKVHITGKMFELLAELDSEGDEEAIKMLQGIQSFDAIIIQESNTAKSDFNQGNKVLGKEFEELMSVNDKEGNATFYINESAGVISEMLMLAHGDAEFIVVSITGNIDLKTVSKIMKEAHMGEYMHSTSIKNMDEFTIYPNPAREDGRVNITLPEGLVGSEYQVIDLQGKIVESGSLNDRNNQISIAGLSKGKYLIKVFKADFTISKKLIVE